VVLEIGLAIAVSVAAGYAARCRWGAQAQHAAGRILDAILWCVLPPCVFVNTAHFRFSTGDVLGLVEGYGILALVGVGAWWLGARRPGLTGGTRGALICCAIIGNTGYFGLPVTIAVLGRSHLGAATAWDAMITGPWSFAGAFAVGAVFGAGRQADRELSRWRRFALRNPVLWALAAGLAAAPWISLPAAVIDPAQLALTILLPVGFGVLGVYLAGDTRRSPWRLPDRSMMTAIGLRMGAAPALFALLASATHGVPTAFYLQAAAPTGINALITSHVHGLDNGYTATVIVWSTLLGLAAILVLVLAGVA
jgi:predicted permease